jgi:transposase
MDKTPSDLYGGLDLHSDNTYCALLDAERNVVFERRLPNHLEAILQALEPYQKRIKTLAVESTFNWYWLVDGLMDHAYDTRLANPARMQENIGLKHANDKTDARFIARQLILGTLPEGYIYPRETRGVRDLMRKRSQMVHDRTTEAQRLTGLCARQTGQDLSARKILDADLAGLFNQHKPSILMAEASKKHIRFLNDQIKELEKAILEQLPDKNAYELLQTGPGIGPVLARCILLETGPIKRFASAGDYASYCRAVPTSHTSNGKTKGEGNAKCGNKHLAWAFVEAANFATRFCPEINAWFQRKLSRNPNLRVVPVKALANKLSKACYFILRENKPFDLARLLGGKAGK